MESPSTSSGKPSWVTADSLGEPGSPGPLSIGLTMHCVAPVLFRLSSSLGQPFHALQGVYQKFFTSMLENSQLSLMVG